MTQGEVFALTLGRNMLSQYTGTAFEPVLCGAIEKIAERLPDRVKVDSADLKGMVTFRTTAAVPISWAMFMDLNRACEQRLSVNITYYAVSKDETTKRMVDPYKLMENRGSWYLVGYCRWRDGMRLFALHRIKEYELSDRKYEPKIGFDVDGWIQSAFQLEHGDEEQLVRVRFSPVGARYIRERNWHPSQRLKEHSNGGLTLEFVTCNLDEVKRWILTYGAEAEVLEPQALRESVIGALKRALNRYIS